MRVIFNRRFYPCVCRHLSEDMQMKSKWKYLLLLFCIAIPVIMGLVIAIVDHIWIRIVTGSLLILILIVCFLLMYESFKKAAAEVKEIRPTTELEGCRRRTNLEPVQESAEDNRPIRFVWPSDVQQPGPQSLARTARAEYVPPRLRGEYLSERNEFIRRRDRHNRELIAMHEKTIKWLFNLHRKGKLYRNVLYQGYLYLLPVVMHQEPNSRIPVRYEGDILTHQEFEAVVKEYYRVKHTEEWFRQYFETRDDSILYQPDIHSYDPFRERFLEARNRLQAIADQRAADAALYQPDIYINDPNWMAVQNVAVSQQAHGTDNLLPQVTQRSLHPSEAEQESAATVTKAEVYRPF